MDALGIFNSCEAVFWIAVGIVVFRRSRSLPRQRLGTVATIWFVLFGISDIFEVYTGAFWRPWPLLVFKGTCIIGLIVCGLAYRQSAKFGK
jgi:hypothetical protein